MSGAALGTCCVLVADRQAVGEAVTSALGTSGLRMMPVEVASSGAISRAADTVHAGLLLHDLDSAECIRKARAVVESLAVPWLVVAGTPRGPGWGAVLEAGARDVVDAAATSIAVISRRLGELAGGRAADEGERDTLLLEWRDHQAVRERLSVALASLRPSALEAVRRARRGESAPGADEALARLGLGTKPAELDLLDELVAHA